MAVTLSLFAGAGAQFFDDNGVVLSGGLVYTYAAGTTTPLAAYTSNTGATALANPIVLDAAGRVPTGEIWLTYAQAYKFTVKTSTGVLIGTYDNIPNAALPPLVNNAASISYDAGASISAGNFTIGETYLITSLGSTNFQSIGAVSNTVGLYFTATGVGSGTGTADFIRSVQTKFQEVLSVKDFGATGNGTTDDTAAIQAAIDAVDPGAILFFPVGDYIVSNLNIQKPIVILGDGVAAMASANPSSPSFGAYLSGTRIKSKTGSSGYQFNITVGSIANSEGRLYGVQFRNIYLFGNNRTVDAGGIKIELSDHCLFEDVFVESFQREAILFNASVRESSISRLRTRFCGTRNTSGTSYPCIGLVESSTSDPINFIKFIDCSFVYSLGDAVLVDHSNGSATGQIHDVYFTDCLFHGTLSFIQGSPYTITADMQQTVLLRNKGGRDIVATNGNFLFAGDNKPHVLSETSTVGGFLPTTQINASTLVNHYSLTSLGRAIEALSGNVLVDQTRIQTSITGSIKVYSGANYLIGQNWFGSGTISPEYDSGSTDLNNVISFTPVLVGASGGTATYSRQTGRATRNGNVMTFTAELVLTSVGTLSGALSIGGLPFNLRTASLQASGSVYFTGAAAGTAGIITRITTAQPKNIVLFKPVSGSASGLGPADITNSFELAVTGSWMVEST